MMCYGAKELARSFRTVRKNTLQIAEEIPEEKYGFSPAPGTRTVAQLLTHIAIARRLQQSVQSAGTKSLPSFDFSKVVGEFGTEEQKPRSKQEVIALLKSEGEQFATWIETITDDVLAERVDQFPGAEPASKTRFEMLMGVKEHEMHHRGQLMLIERMLGITPHLTREMQARMAARA